MTARTDTEALQARLNRAGIPADFAQAHDLRRAQITLHRWAELECGDGNDYAGWAIERDEATDKPYLVTYPHKGEPQRRAIPDREKGALRRVEAICKALGCYFYHQTDPRGCALYVSREPIKDHDYTRGVACCV